MPSPDDTRTDFDDEFQRALGRARIVGLGIAGAATVLVVLLGGERRRVEILALAVLLVGASLVFQRPDAARGRPRLLLATIFVAQFMVIGATGGFVSPLIIVPIPIALAAGLVFPRHEALWLVLPAALGLFTLALLFVTGAAPWLEFGALDRRGGEAGVWMFAAAVAAVLVLSTVFGGTLRGILAQSALQRRRLAAEARAAVEDRNREILALSAELAHELKNPLAAIQGLATLLARRAPEGSPDGGKFQVLVSEIARMSGIVDEFLSFSRPVTALATAPVLLAELLAEVVLLHEAAAAERGVTIDASAEPSVEASCDARKIKQIVVNLLQNALDAAPPGSRVRLGAAREGARVVVWVEDRGPGLAPSVKSRLFTPGVTAKPGGSGLGLTIARTLAEQHGGRLEVGDRPGGGCRARLSLPLEKEAA